VPLLMQEVDFTRPTAFVLGNERAGVSETAVAMADHTAIIPMVRRAQHLLAVCCTIRLVLMQGLQARLVNITYITLSGQ
jgi:tRNA (guanosine-2'-O-)-methyltransferase